MTDESAPPGERTTAPAAGAAGAPPPTTGEVPRQTAARADAQNDRDDRNAQDAPGTPGAAGRPESGAGEGYDGDAGERPSLRRGTGQDKVLAGVCHGAARYFGVDPVIFRIVLVVLALTGGIGLIVYGMGWLVVPQQGEHESEAHRLLSGRIDGAPLTAVLMTLVGCGLYASMIGNGANQAFSLLLLAATAGAVYWSQQRGRAGTAGEAPVAAGPAVDAPPAAQAPPEPSGTPSWWREPMSKEPGYLWGPAEEEPPPAGPQPWRTRLWAPAPRKEHAWVFGMVVFLLAATAATVGTGVSWPYQPVGASLEIGLAAALGVFGLGYLIASFAGRPRFGTAFWSLLTIAGLVCAAALPKTGQGVGASVWRPLAASAVRPVYERGAGTGELDLTGLRLQGAEVRTELKLGTGRATLRLPRNAIVHLRYDVGLGDVRVPDEDKEGVDVKRIRHKALDFGPVAGTPSAGTVDVTVHVGVGQLRVLR